MTVMLLSSASMSKKRIELLDAIRGVDIFAVIYYHFAYDLAMFGIVPWDFIWSAPMQILERTGAAIFVIMAGFSSRLSRNNLKRGVQVFLCGVVVSAGSAIAGITIRFGILQLLGSCMMLYGLFGTYLQKLPRWTIPAVSLPAFCGGYYMYRNMRFGVDWLYPLGLRGVNFTSADYFPLIPWFFAFLIGTWLGGELLKGERKPWMDKKYPKIFTVPGRHTLIIYMVHQIPLYAIAWGLAMVI